MPFSQGGSNPSVQYHAIRSSPLHEENSEHEEDSLHTRPQYIPRGWLIGGVISVVILIAITSKYILTCEHTSALESSNARAPRVRQEWRSLAAEEKREYIAAVQCLTKKPSKIGLNQSLYDDFPYVHSQVGEYSHESAAFLAWHRWFIYTYEQMLKNECGYQGELPYWDWTLDWQDITKAPVWSNDVGFGRSGDPSVDEMLLNGTCVTSGPFAHLQVLYLKDKVSEHCLSRGFLDPDSSKMEELSQWIRPSMIKNILSEPHYNDFNLRLEENSHIAIPRMIQGDFLLLTAPYDPVFFLHHAQLDRLWFRWQRLGQGRAWQYEGLAAHDATEGASLQDSIRMGGLAPDIAVSEIMDTRTGPLGYVYL